MYIGINSVTAIWGAIQLAHLIFIIAVSLQHFNYKWFMARKWYGVFRNGRTGVNKLYSDVALSVSYMSALNLMEIIFKMMIVENCIFLIIKLII